MGFCRAALRGRKLAGKATLAELLLFVGGPPRDHQGLLPAHLLSELTLKKNQNKASKMSLKLPRNWDFNLKMDAGKIGTVSVSLCPSVPAGCPGAGAGCGQAQLRFWLWPQWGDLATKCHFGERADGLQMICKK